MIRKSAKELLVESFRELTALKSIDKITIKEITDNCGYSPATFYRQFRDKYDLIAWDYTRELERIMSQMDGNISSWRQTLKDGAFYFNDQREYLANLFLHTSGLDSFVAYMRKINYEYLKESIIKSAGKDSIDSETDIYIRVYVLGTVQLTCEWILGNVQLEPEELAKIYANSLPTPLLKYFK